MNNKILNKSKISDFLKSLMNKQTVVAPMERKNSPAEFRELNPGDEPILDGSKSMMPPKDYLLPRYEVLVKVDTTKGNVKVESPLPEDKPRVLLGAWLADTQALQVLDKVFLDDKFKDPYYAARRDNMTIVAVMPKKLRWSWFSTSVADVESWKSSADAIMYDLGDSFYFEPITQKGEALITSDLFTDPTKAEIEQKDSVWNAFISLPKEKFAGKAIYEKLVWDDPVWGEIAEKCISCGMCSYMCPSCSCFDIQDETTSGHCVERYRCRDTCQFKDFTLMGAGHNPRANKLPRARQRLLHKFKYQHEQFNVVACTGCGRCVELCPVGVDVREVLNHVCTEPVSE